MRNGLPQDSVKGMGVALTSAALLFACTGQLGDGTADPGSSGVDGPGVSHPPFAPAPAPLRRLTRTQFRNAVKDLTGVEVDVRDLDADSYKGEFAVVGASTVVTSPLGVERFHLAIEAAVAEVFSDPKRAAAFVGCSAVSADDGCVRNFLVRLGRRAWRRPLDAEELERLVSVSVTAALELESIGEGPRWATVALLTSPHFLYRPELGELAQDGTHHLTAYELASRLAFLLWNSLPDEPLLDEAESGALSTTKGLIRAAERMLEAPAGREAASAFAEEYMRLDRLATQPKDSGLFPEYGPTLQSAMARDMRETWSIIGLDPESSLLELFRTTQVVANAELANVYGLSLQGLDSSTFETLSLPAGDPRAGILSKPAFLSQFANQKEGSPTLRGKFIREAFMCRTVPAPPGDIALEVPEAVEGMPTTKRERLDLHRSAPGCAGCHALMDPLGLPFENYDAIGRFRDSEQGLTIDPSGDFDGIPVADARELGFVMSTSDAVAECLVRKYYTYAMGHEERDVDEGVIASLTGAFRASDYRMRTLILDLVASQAFQTVAPQHP